MMSSGSSDAPSALVTPWEFLRELNTSPRPLESSHSTVVTPPSQTPNNNNNKKANRRSIDASSTPGRKTTTPSPRKKGSADSDRDRPTRRIERSKSQSQIDRSSSSRVPRAQSFSLRGHHETPSDLISSPLSTSVPNVGAKTDKKRPVDLRLLVLGSTGVGKSCLVLRYLQGVFLERYDPTVEDAHLKQVERNGVTYMVEIIDTAGAEAYTSLTDVLIRKVDGVLLLYSVNSFSSFLKAIELNDKLDIAHETDPLPKVFVGTKLDLAKTHREVQVDAVNDTATRCRCPWAEVSAKDNIAVEDPFLMLIDRILAHQSQTKKTGCTVM